MTLDINMDIKFLSAGMIIEDIFAVIKVERKDAASGKKFLKAELSHVSGMIGAKVWEESIPTAPLEPNKVYRISGRVDAYKGSLGLVITQAWQLDDEVIENHLKPRKSLVFDIETAGEDYEDLDKWSQDYLLDKLQYNTQDKEKAKQATALYPMFGQVVAIGMLNTQSCKGQVLALKKNKVKDMNLDDVNFTLLTFESEKQLLKHFWQIAAKFEHFISFNGNNFDWPYIIFRSAKNLIKIPFEITRSQDQQTDLMDKFKGSAIYSLEALCRAFSITNPKEKGISGLHVSKLFKQDKTIDIANYVSRDVVSTWELFEIWKKYMAGKIVL